jgi:glycine/sarcosine N-methyltransferase
MRRCLIIYDGIDFIIFKKREKRMGTIYDNTEIYDIGFDEKKWQIVKEHWKKIFDGTKVNTILDCSIGTGNITLQLSELGYQLTGSDLSANMLKKCEEKARERNINVQLFQSDFREIAENTEKMYDCVMSTGNSLPYVENDEVIKTLHIMDSLVSVGGYIYLDTRNWDKIIKEHQRFYFYPPIYRNDYRIDEIQFWDYMQDGSIIFHIVYSFEKEQKIVQREIFEEKYFPIRKELILDELKQMGYRIIKNVNFPIQCSLPPEEFDWYCILAQK